MFDRSMRTLRDFRNNFNRIVGFPRAMTMAKPCHAGAGPCRGWTRGAERAIVARRRRAGCCGPRPGIESLWNSMTLGTRLYTWGKGELVGTDQFGNRYFREKGVRVRVRGGGMPSRDRRWVLYNGAVEASRVPPSWHGWLPHH